MVEAASVARMRKAASPRQVLAIVCVGICLANLDLFIVNVALPSISADLGGARMADLSWVLNGYAIVYASLLVFFGRLAERHRRDLSFLLGVCLFTVASAACGLAQSVEALVLFRLVQAAGAALMTPTSIGLLLASFAPEERGWAVRTWAAIGGLAAAAGPLIGGVLVIFNWRWIFIVNVPIGLAAILIGWLRLPRVEGHEAPRPSFGAAVLVTIGVAALTLAIVKGGEWGWRSENTALTAATAVVALGLFALHCGSSKNPFIDPALFKIRAFTGAVLVMAPYSAAFGAMLLSIALWEQSVWGWSPMKTGLCIAPGPLMVPITSLFFGSRLIARFGPAAVIVAGIVAFAAGLIAWATLFRAEPDVVIALIGIMLTGTGVGLTFPTVMGAGTAALPSSSFATGSGVINMIRQAALAVGVAIFVAVVGQPVGVNAQIQAFHLAWWILAGITLISAVPALLLIRRP